MSATERGAADEYVDLSGLVGSPLHGSCRPVAAFIASSPCAAILLVPFAVAIAWRSSADAFAQILGRYGLHPDAVTDTATAWQAFEEFVQVAVDGIDPDPDADSDGFIVQWGRTFDSEGLASLSFTRQLAMVATRDHDDPYWQPELWQVDLQMNVDDRSDPIDFDSLYTANTDFSFEPVGPRRAAALAAARRDLERQPQLHRLWRMTPVSSELTFFNAC